jgi:hypothetical protein
MQRRWLRRMAVIGMAVMAPALATPAGAVSTTGIWRVASTPNPGSGQVSNVFFTAVSASSSSDAWAVGMIEAGSFRRPLLEHWDGTSWQAMEAPRPSRKQAWFNGVLDLGPADAWAVGESTSPDSTGQTIRTLIEHWDGISWSIVPSPNPAVAGNSGDLLSGIAGVGPTDLWAVGSVHDDPMSENVLLFEHYDGVAWTAFPTPSPPGAEHFGSAIAAIASDDAWAVGTEALELTLAAHWNGRRWKLVPTPSLHDGISPLNSLTGVTAIDSRNVWASGYEGNVDNQNFMKPYMLHWDGTTWTLVPTPNQGGEGSRLNATVALSKADVWAVGQTQELDGTILTLTQQFNGTIWTTVASPSPAGGGLTIDSLHGVTTAGAGFVVAVGAREIAGQCCLRTLALMTRDG